MLIVTVAFALSVARSLDLAKLSHSLEYRKGHHKYIIAAMGVCYVAAMTYLIWQLVQLGLA